MAASLAHRWAFQKSRCFPAAALLPRCRSASASTATAGGSAGSETKPRHLRGVRHVLAVASGKGGVGKSSISVNLAYLLARGGYRVGLLDADIYGPSLPELLPLEAKGVFASKSGAMQPLMYEGVKLMSMGYVRPGEHAAIRGPLVSAMVQQLLTQTEWGELDYLVIDMPPGTGDIHLTVAQTAQVSAAIVVSTAHRLSLADVEKGIAMFNKVNIPTIAVAENMSTFVCGSCNTEHALFDRPGSARRIVEQFGVPAYVQLPLDPVLSGGHGQQPFVLDAAHSGRPLCKKLEALAEVAVRELDALGIVQRSLAMAQPGTDGQPRLELKRTAADGKEDIVLLPARAVRLACRSATMIDEFTGERLFREEDIAKDVWAKKIWPAGSYAVNIDWSDGHNSLMPFSTLDTVKEDGTIL